MFHFQNFNYTLDVFTALFFTNPQKIKFNIWSQNLFFFARRCFKEVRKPFPHLEIENLSKHFLNFFVLYSPLGNCRRPTLIDLGPEIAGKTLKKSTTLIQFGPCRDVCDA